LDLGLWKGRFPSIGAQFCTEETKVKPIQDQVIVPALEGGDVVQWLGIRRQESKKREDTPVFRRVRWIEPKRNLIYYAPLAEWTWQDVFAMHDRHGIKPNPLYSKGAGRVGCWPCIHARKAELALIARIDPAAPELLREWEILVADASKRGAATFFSADTTPEGRALTEWVTEEAEARVVREYPDTPKYIKSPCDEWVENPDFTGLAGKYRTEISATVDWPSVIDVMDWSKTARGGRQYDLITAIGACASEYGLCE
jgi:hypothetical protein